jgi:hypothetical protein
MNDELFRETVFALLDLLDGCDVGEIEYHTGLPRVRCEEIRATYVACYNKYGKLWRDR